MSADAHEETASSGIEGLDVILAGGFPRGEMQLVLGSGGAGKTTLALQFLLAGRAREERSLYITISQSRRALARIMRSHGWSLDNLRVHELLPSDVADAVGAEQTVLHTADAELGELTRELRDVVDREKPQRVVFDSLGALALLAGDRQRYRREVAALAQFLASRGCTSLFLLDVPTDGAAALADAELHALATSVVHLEQLAPEYGDARRRLRIIKVRGVAVHGGYHDFCLRKGGLEVYPRLVPAEGAASSDFELVATGVATLDRLLGGGLELGTAALFVGPPGSGKSTVASIFAQRIAQSGRYAAIFLFEERPETFLERAGAVGFDLRPHVKSGRLSLEKLDTARISAGAFANRVRRAIEVDGAKLVVIDSLTGYLNAMRNASMLVVQMHELLDFASRRGVLTLLTVSQTGFMATGETENVDLSYLSDSIVVLRSFEHRGVVRRCIAAVKKRQGEHENGIHELVVERGRVSVSDAPITGVQNMLTGAPMLVADDE